MNTASTVLSSILIFCIVYTITLSISTPSPEEYAFANAVADEACKQDNSTFSRFELKDSEIKGVYCSNNEFIDKEMLEKKSHEVEWEKAYDTYNTYYHNIL